MNEDCGLQIWDMRLALWNFASGEPAAGGIPQGGGWWDARRVQRRIVISLLTSIV
jgi:hypothetical protein